MQRIRATLAEYRVEFDIWFLERSLHDGDPSAVDRGFARLAEQGTTYRADGALWLRTTALGDDKDRVLERSTGEPTYFASDVAYTESKLERGFDRLVIVLGSDHHGYIARHAGGDGRAGRRPRAGCEIPILQFVHIVERGERASMSKRRGDFITLDELIERDRRRRDALLHAPALARLDGRPRPRPRARAVGREPRLLRPVRPRADRLACCARRARSAWRRPSRCEPGELALEPAERELVKKLLAFPGEVAEAAERRAPHRIATYALELAQAFTAFYRDCRVVGAEPEELESFRIGLSVAAKRTIARSLDLLGVSAPETM